MEKERKNEAIAVQLTPSAKSLWERIAKEQGRTMAEFVRYAVSCYITALEIKRKKGKQ